MTVAFRDPLRALFTKGSGNVSVITRYVQFHKSVVGAALLFQIGVVDNGTRLEDDHLVADLFHISQKTLPWMLRAGSGHIVTITAAIAEQPMASVPAGLTALTKGGLNAATRSLAIEFAGRGVRVNAISPGVIRTPMHSPEMHGFLAGLQPLGRMGETQEILSAVLYLEKTAFVTGEILHVDGGACAGRW